MYIKHIFDVSSNDWCEPVWTRGNEDVRLPAWLTEGPRFDSASALSPPKLLFMDAVFVTLPVTINDTF